MTVDLTPVLAATARWLLNAYPATGGSLGRALAEPQARQATTVACALRYPSAIDAALLLLVGPGGATRLDRIVCGHEAPEGPDHTWRGWVDEVVASWAACLLSDQELAHAAIATLRSPGTAAIAFRRLTTPSARDRRAAALLRHPDLVAPIADLHRSALLAHLVPPAANAA